MDINQYKNIRQHADYLLYLWFGMMVFTIIISATFQYDLASTPIQRFVGVGLGILFPLITSALLTSSIHLFSSRFHLWELGALLIFLAAFVWEGHSHYSFWANAMETKAENSSFNRVQTEQLKTLDERLSNLPVVGSFFSDSLDKKIAGAEDALSKCPRGHASVCINPNQERLQRLYAERDNKGVQAQVKNQRDALLEEKQQPLKAISGGDISTENLKAMPVFKDVSVFFYSDFSHAKQFEATAYFAFSLLCTVIASGLLGIRSKLLESEESPQQYTPKASYDPLAPQQQKPESWKERYKRGDVGLASAMFGRGREPSAQPSANADAAIGDFADAINRKNSATADAMNQTARRGRGDFREYDDVITPTKINTTSPTLMSGAGFGAQEIPNPNYQAPIIHWQKESPAGVEIDLPDAVEITPPAASHRVCMDADVRVQTDANAVNANSNNGGGNGRGTASILDYADLVDAVRFSNYLQNPKKDMGIIGQNRVMEFMSVGRPVAKRYIERLVAEGVTDKDWRVV